MFWAEKVPTILRVGLTLPSSGISACEESVWEVFVFIRIVLSTQQINPKHF